MMTLLVPLLVLVGAGSQQPTSDSTPGWNVVFCQPDLQEPFKRGYAFFSIVYALTLDRSGVPQSVKRIKDPGVHNAVDDAEVERCLLQWRLPTRDLGNQLEVEMRWTHGFGWEWMEIRSRRYRQRIMMGGNPCKYR